METEVKEVPTFPAGMSETTEHTDIPPPMLPATDKVLYKHIVANPYDPHQDYAAFAQAVFNPNEKILVMREAAKDFHVHMQGEVLNMRTYLKRKAELTESHEAKKKNPKCHPIKERTKPADCQGFQYMSKDLPNSVVIYKANITDEELNDLHQKSVEHVAEIKSGVLTYIRGRFTAVQHETLSPAILHRQVSLFAQEHYLEDHKMDPPNIRGLVRYWLRELFGFRADVLEYLAELNL